MKIPLKYIFAASTLILIVLLLNQCSSTRGVRTQLNTFIGYKDTVKIYKNKYDDIVAINDALIIDNITLKQLKKQNRDLREKLHEFKDVNTVTIVKTITRIDTVNHYFTDSIECVFHKDFTIDSPYYSIGGLLTQHSITFDRIQFPNEQYIVVGTQRKNILSRKQYVVTSTNSNPYIQTIGLQSYTIVPNKKPWQKWYVHVGIGVVAGFLIAK